MNGREGAIVGTPRERNLKLARHALIERIAQEMIGHRLRIGRYIEDLTLAHPRKMARRDIAHGIGAGFASRQPDFS